jgi:hypothetical protein
MIKALEAAQAVLKSVKGKVQIHGSHHKHILFQKRVVNSETLRKSDHGA